MFDYQAYIFYPIQSLLGGKKDGKLVDQRLFTDKWEEKRVLKLCFVIIRLFDSILYVVFVSL